MTHINVGIIGLGVISRFYVAALPQVPDLRLAAVCDLREEVLRPYRGRVDCYRRHLDMLDGAELDAIVVNVPNDAHAPVCRDVVRAGLAVCVEKPLATDLADGRALVALARAHGVPLFTALHRRYNENVRALRAALPVTVPVRSVTVRYLERIEDHAGADRWYLDPRRCGGGCVADNGPNALDLVRLFLGEVDVVDAELGRDERGVDRAAAVHLRAAGGASGRVELDWDHPGECKDVEVVLADGRVFTADMLAGHPTFKGSLWHEYVGVLNDFVFTMAAGVPGDTDGLAALELVDAVYERARPREGRR
jgi:predicted dehydrogenase